MSERGNVIIEDVNNKEEYQRGKYDQRGAKR